MSRYNVPVKDSSHIGFIGYDPPLQTYFATIELLDELVEPEADPVILWVGAESRIHTVEELIAAIEEYAQIPPALQDRLRADKQAAPLPSRFQQDIISRFGTFKDSQGE